MTAENIEIKPALPRRRDTERAGGWSYRPRIDITEEADEFTVLADIPGATGDTIAIDFDNGMLTIHGTVPPRQNADIEFLAHEYGIGDFDRQLAISDLVDADKITAHYERGVLTVHLPKSEQAKPRRIPICSA